jgi:uncharacterized lipoprotein YddW (UPF0748 family)
MVPRAAAQAALTAPRSALPALIERYREQTDAEGLYLSPSAPGAVAHLESVVGELLRAYAVDGLHLDFIRYPGPEFDWSRPALEGFARGGDLMAAPNLDPEGWEAYRRAALDALAARLSETARAARPGILVSAAVVPDLAQALHHRYQSWPSWVDRGLVDAVCPMAYTADTRIFRAQIEQARERLGPAALVWAGVGAYRLDLGGVIEKVQAAREVGASGVVVFSHESLAPAEFERLRDAAFPTPAAAAAGAGYGPRGRR